MIDSLFQDVEGYLKESIVFVDRSITECILWNKWVEKLWKMGVLTMMDFSSSEHWLHEQSFKQLILRNDVTSPKAVFWIEVFCTENEVYVKQAIDKYHFEKVMILHAFSDSFLKFCRHSYTYAEMSEKIQKWMIDSQKRKHPSMEPYVP